MKTAKKRTNRKVYVGARITLEEHDRLKSEAAANHRSVASELLWRLNRATAVLKLDN